MITAHAIRCYYKIVLRSMRSLRVRPSLIEAEVDDLDNTGFQAHKLAKELTVKKSNLIRLWSSD